MNQISIPFGAINSGFNSTPEQDLYISIPFGAINSVLLRSKGYVYVEFQFLLVRLIDRTNFINLIISDISIPFGAINRVIPARTTTENNIFQFLLVRLIVYWVKSHLKVQN